MAYCWESECDDPEYTDLIHIKPYPDGESSEESGSGN